MLVSTARWSLLGLLFAAGLGSLSLWGNEPPQTGPRTEKRFPSLQVPVGFKATLFACDPLIEYPSAICVGPRPGAIFVAVDYMTGLGTDIIRRDEIRLVEDTDGDGYADKATVFAKGFNSIQGLAYHDGTLFVMHAPYLTALRDTKGTGLADERRDLLTGLGLTPEENPVRLHCANGVVVGHDGWLYLALGDHGVNVLRPEGDRLVLRGGGILRCRPDGQDLHIFATGLRNIYDVALDAELNVFVRDNENDGGTYMIRVCHSFFGADHGYPYLYEERPNQALPPLADLGLGSSAGGLCYLEKQFPADFQGNLFFCEWGRAVVRYPPRRQGSSFAPLREIDFASGAANDPYGFKPTDLVAQRDGTLMVSDWADGQRPKRGRGRIYHIAHAATAPHEAKKAVKEKVSPEHWLAQLNSESYYERWDAQMALERLGVEGRQRLTEALKKGRLETRGRLHAIWSLTHLSGPTTMDDLLAIAQSDPDPSVRAQAIRALGDMVDPVLTRHRLDAGPGDVDLARRLAALGKGQDNQVMLEIVIALGRLRWAGLPVWLRNHLDKPDPALAHGAMQALRRSENWTEILKLLGETNGSPLRSIALRAVAERFVPKVVDGLIERLRTETDSQRRKEYGDALARVYRMPGPWNYWGYRPPPRPVNTVPWEKTEAIAEALDRLLADPDRDVRLAVLRRMQREKVPQALATLQRWLKDEHQTDRVATILASLHDQPTAAVRSIIEEIVRDGRHSSSNRQAALALLDQGLDSTNVNSFLGLIKALEDGPVLADGLRRIGRFPRRSIILFLVAKTKSPAPEVRAAAIATLAAIPAPEGGESTIQLLQDKDQSVRLAAAGAAGKLGEKRAIEPLLRFMADKDPTLRRASLDSLRLLREPRAVPLAVVALTDRELELKALECLKELGGPDQAGAVMEFAIHNPSHEVLSSSVRVLTTWKDRANQKRAPYAILDDAVAQVQGTSGVLVRWQADANATGAKWDKLLIAQSALIRSTPFHQERTLFATGPEGRVILAPKADSDEAWLAYTDVKVNDSTPVEFLASSSGSLKVLLNGELIHQRDRAQEFQIDSDRFAGTLREGRSRLLVQVGPSSTPVVFHLRFRPKSAKVDHERLTKAVLTRPGNPDRGRKLFFDVEKSQCLKCHRLNDQGERIGPDLTGVAKRFSRIYIVESILEPSRTIAPSFATQVVTLKSGMVLTGVKVAETETALTLADNQGQKHVLEKAEIAELQASPLSTMPEGLEKRFSEEEFLDLIAFLVSQRT